MFSIKEEAVKKKNLFNYFLFLLSYYLPSRDRISKILYYRFISLLYNYFVYLFIYFSITVCSRDSARENFEGFGSGNILDNVCTIGGSRSVSN